MPTVTSRPGDYSSAYTPLEYTFIDPRAGATASAFTFIEDITGKVAIGFNNISLPGTTSNSSITWFPVGSKVVVSNSDLYDGEYFVTESSSQGRVVIDTPYIGDDTTGDIVVFWDNVQIIADLYIDGNFTSRKRRFPDGDGIFTVNFEKEVQSELGVGLSPKDISVAGHNRVKVDENTASISIRFAVQTSNNGVIDLSPDTLFDDSANTSIIVNAVVPYVEWKVGTTRGELESVTTDLSDFKVDSGGVVQTTDYSFRFLTNSPKTITIGSNDSYELYLLIERDSPRIQMALDIKFYDETGALILTHTPGSTNPSQDGVWGYNVGLRNMITGFPSDAATMASAHYYDVKWTNNLGSPSDLDVTETIRFNVDKKCYGSETRFKWLNPRGGYDSFTFKSPRKLKSSVSKETYEPSRVHPVVIGNRERSILDVQAKDVLTVVGIIIAFWFAGKASEKAK